MAVDSLTLTVMAAQQPSAAMFYNNSVLPEGGMFECAECAARPIHSKHSSVFSDSIFQSILRSTSVVADGDLPLGAACATCRRMLEVRRAD